VLHLSSSPPAGGDHAGMYETSYMLAACPSRVDMSRLGPEGPWYTKEPSGPSAAGTAERGEAMFGVMAAAWAAELRGK
jgi:creatinine amidohydrolase/Fe(II)-dependent formamide hydrolase-like protein